MSWPPVHEGYRAEDFRQSVKGEVHFFPSSQGGHSNAACVAMFGHGSPLNPTAPRARKGHRTAGIFTDHVLVGCQISHGYNTHYVAMDPAGDAGTSMAADEGPIPSGKVRAKFSLWWGQALEFQDGASASSPSRWRQVVADGGPFASGRNMGLRIKPSARCGPGHGEGRRSTVLRKARAAIILLRRQPRRWGGSDRPDSRALLQARVLVCLRRPACGPMTRLVPLLLLGARAVP